MEDLFQVSKSIKFAAHTVMNDGNGRPPLMILHPNVCVNAFEIALEPVTQQNME